MKVSVVIPAYNEQRYLGACLESLLGQTVPAAEIIVVDNNSTDRTAQVARRFPNVRVLREPKQGIVYARNRGFNAASGDIIARIDADTRVPPHWITQLHSLFQSPDISGVTGPPSFCDTAWSRLMSSFYKLIVFDFHRHLLHHHILWGANCAIKKDAWASVHTSVCNSSAVHEDLDLAIHLTRQGGEISYEPNLVVDASLRRLHQANGFGVYLGQWYQTLAIHGCRTYGLDKLVGYSALFTRPLVSRFLKMARAFAHHRIIAHLFLGQSRFVQ